MGMKENFPLALQTTLKWEGGYVDDPKDPGGATYQGITQVTYDAWRKSKGAPTRHVILMIPEERDAIYHQRYWDTINADGLAAGVDVIGFDISVNSGPSRIIHWLQVTINSIVQIIPVEENRGPAILLGFMQHAPKDPVACVRYLDQKRRSFWKSLPIFKRFGKGWLNRENDVFSVAMKLAIGKKFPHEVES